MDYQIVHAIEGRLRLRIPLLATNDGFAAKLQPLIEAIAFVTSVRISPPAQSIIVTYKYKKLAQATLLQAVEAAIAQAAPPPEEPDIQPSSELTPESTPEPIAQNPIEIPLKAVRSTHSTDAQPAAADSPIASGSEPAASEAGQPQVGQPQAGQPQAAVVPLPAADDFDPASIELEDPWADQLSVFLDAVQSGEKTSETSSESEPAADRAGPAIDESLAACDRPAAVTPEESIAADRNNLAPAVKPAIAIDEAAIESTAATSIEEIASDQALVLQRNSEEMESNSLVQSPVSEAKTSDADCSVNFAEADGSTSTSKSRKKNDRRSKSSEKRSRAS